ncbi:phosphate uptake regulator PhoU [Dysgonomonas sp. 25]|nr:phosphate uptake regulator PhoU [Dysgonomonas sp. 25]
MTINMKNKQLQILLNDFELLSKTTLLQLQIVTKLLQDNKIDALIAEAEQNEIIIDRLEVKIREEIVFAIFQFTPKAADLRKIITYQDITSNLERVGDMLLNIIHFLKDMELKDKDFSEIAKMIDKMLGYVSEMLRNAIFSFGNEDPNVAYEIIKEDDKVDQLFWKIKISLQQTFANKQLSEEKIQNIINFDSISHNLERIGDSATNIAEATIYLTEGKDIRHGNK